LPQRRRYVANPYTIVTPSRRQWDVVPGEWRVSKYRPSSRLLAASWRLSKLGTQLIKKLDFVNRYFVNLKVNYIKSQSVEL